MRYGSVCSGIEAASVAWHPLGWSAAWLAEIERFPSQVLAHHYPNVPNLGDMTKISRRVLTGEVEAPDVLVGGTPCFTAGHMVLCSTGYKPIQDMIPGDMVVTHKGRLRPVVRIGNKLADVGVLSGVGMPCGITTTPDHPFLSVNFRMQSTKRQGAYAKVEHCGEPEWTPASELSGRNWCALKNHEAIDAPILSTKFSDETAMYLAGMYLGDGYIRDWGMKTKKAVVFCLNDAKLEKFKASVGGANFSISKERTVTKVIVCDTRFATWLQENFGRGSDKKRVPAWAMGHPLRDRLIQGYIDTDGHARDNGFRANSVSRALAYGMADLANSAGYVASVSFVPKEPTCVIEGRTCNQKSYWSVLAVHSAVSRKSRVRHGYLLRAVTKFEETGIDRVFNIEVQDDNSFILDGAVVHNCQAFSIAGLREGLSDERGQLTISYVRLFDAIDYIRSRAGKRPAIACWENVPGVLSSKDNAFGCFLGALAGEDVELIPPGKKWANAGCVFGPTRTVAWRILDAQYFGVAQRRRRVFVIASARKDFNPAAVLFEFDGVRRDIAPSRQARQDVAGTVTASLGRRCGVPDGGDTPGYLQPVASTGDVSHCLNAGGMGRQDFETETLIAQATPFVSAVCPTLRAGGNSTGGDRPPGTDVDTSDSLIVQPAYSVALRGREGGATAELGGDIAGCLRASSGGGDKPHVLASVLPFDTTQITSATNRSQPDYGDPCHPLAAGAHAPAIAFSCKDYGNDASIEIAPTMRAMNSSASHQNGGGQLAIAIAFDSRQDTVSSEHVFGALGSSSPQAQAVCVTGDVTHTLKAEGFDASEDVTGRGQPIVAFQDRFRGDDGRGYPRAPAVSMEQVGTLETVKQWHVASSMAVRRLTPIECERLQGFLDDYTFIPTWNGWRKMDLSETPESCRADGLEVRQNKKTGKWRVKDVDGPRYKSLGNSMCVDVMAFIGRRIQQEIAA